MQRVRMLYREIFNAFDEYQHKYGDQPAELFINWATYENLLRDPYLNPPVFQQRNPVSTVFNCPVYVLTMDEPYLWLSHKDLVSLTKSKGEPWCNNSPYIPIHRKNLNQQIDQINIPVAIREFEYPVE